MQNTAKSITKSDPIQYNIQALWKPSPSMTPSEQYLFPQYEVLTQLLVVSHNYCTVESFSGALNTTAWIGFWISYFVEGTTKRSPLLYI